MGPHGVHIFDRSTGVNVLLDEVDVPEAVWARAPRHISVALTNACELSCHYCYAPKRPSALDFDRLTGWLTELDDNGCLGVGFGGGEPTLYRRFAEICRYATRKTGLAVTFTTHGHNLTENLIATLHGNVHFVRLSMDGVGATYEALRGRRFSSFLDRVKLASTLAPVGINYLVNKQTVANLDHAIELAMDFGVAEFLLLPEQPVNGRGGIDSCTAKILKSWVELYRGPIPLTLSEVASDGVSVANAFAGESSLQGYAHIDAWGTVKRTSFDDDGQAIGADGVIKALGLLNGIQGDNRI